MEPSNDIFVFGVGRSGTTVTYGYCQKTLARLAKRPIRSVYEPFLWKTDLFDRPYEDCARFFGKTSSVSIAGIYNHLSIPLFSFTPPDPKIIGNTFFAQFGPSEKRPARLFKIIRGNGRLNLFRALNPHARFLVLIRNPLACVNSVKYKFDYFGSDFYPSDLERFCDELHVAGKPTIDPMTAVWAVRQAEYVHQMNAAAVEFALSDPLTLLVEYDAFVRDKPRTAAAIAQFLGWPEEQHEGAGFSKTMGPATSSIVLSETEFNAIAPYARRHVELCEQFQAKNANHEAQLLERFRGKCLGSDYDARYDGLVPNALRRAIRSLEHQAVARTQEKSR